MNARPFHAHFLNFGFGKRASCLQRRSHEALIQLFRAVINEHRFRLEGIKLTARIHQLGVNLVVIGLKHAQRQIHFQCIAANRRRQQLRSTVAQQGKAHAVRRFRIVRAIPF